MIDEFQHTAGFTTGNPMFLWRFVGIFLNLSSPAANVAASSPPVTHNRGFVPVWPPSRSRTSSSTTLWTFFHEASLRRLKETKIGNRNMFDDTFSSGSATPLQPPPPDLPAPPLPSVPCLCKCPGPEALEWGGSPGSVSPEVQSWTTTESLGRRLRPAACRRHRDAPTMTVDWRDKRKITRKLQLLLFYLKWVESS